MLTSYLPVLVLLAVAGGLASVLLFVPKLLGPSKSTPEKQLPVESGMDPIRAPRLRFNAQFYRVALLFLVFDIEAAFFYPWAVMFRDLSCTGEVQNGVCRGAVSPFGFLVMLVFLAVLLLALIFVWRKKALEWD
ncbi:MAG: NADH-quinone oxidoreductase subunit A [Deltaproteobacteria bacterium]|nr:NADH-quinone oxidoreductase subunit A [Deltaproteobacteria bacterium]